MVHKLALIIGGVGVAAVLALAVVLGGFPAVVTGSAEATVADQVIDDSALAPGAGDESTGKVKTVVDTIFIEDSSGSGGPPDASPQPTASPSADGNGGRRDDGRRDDDGHGDRHHDDHDDDDDRDDDDRDHSGHGHGGDDDDDDHGRRGHSDDDHDRDDD